MAFKLILPSEKLAAVNRYYCRLEWQFLTVIWCVQLWK